MTTIYILTILNVKNRSVLPICTQYFTCIYKGIKTRFLQLCADDVVIPRI